LPMIIPNIPEEYLKSFLYHARWWPWKANKKPSITIEERVEKPPLIIFMIRVQNDRIFLPLLVDDTPPASLPAARVMEISGKYVYEAEYSPRYLELIGGMEEFKRKTYGELRGRPIKAEPLSLETTNILSKVTLSTGVEVVVKSYRLLSKVNIEAKILGRLTESNYKYSPRLYHTYTFHNYDVTLVMQYIRGEGDGGAPFYNACVDYLEKHGRGLLLGLAGKLGVIIGGLHMALNSVTDNFFGPEEISNGDVELWVERLWKRNREIRRILDSLADSDPEYYEYWRQLYDKKAGRIIEEAAENMEAYRGMMKARIHQDLHLAQMIYVPDKRDFIITDFEGEPGRTLEEKLMKEPPLRDIASMIRSFQYLAFAAYMNVNHLNIGEAARRLSENDSTIEWQARHIAGMTASYIASTAFSRLHGISAPELAEGIRKYLYPWIVERALYEVYYEAKYRPEWIPVPLVGLLNPIIPRLTVV
jgi:maltokinase